MINNDEDYIMNYLALLKERRQILNTESEELRDEIEELERVDKYKTGDVVRNSHTSELVFLCKDGDKNKAISLLDGVLYNPIWIRGGEICQGSYPVLGKFDDVFIEKQKIMDIFDNCTDRPEKCGCGDKIWDLL